MRGEAVWDSSSLGAQEHQSLEFSRGNAKRQTVLEAGFCHDEAPAVREVCAQLCSHAKLRVWGLS